jgi:calcium-dependent protein kinase
MGGWWSASKNIHNPRNPNANLSKRPTIIRAGSFKQIREKYYIYPTFLGIGTYGKVFLAHFVANKDVKAAIKTLSKKKLSEQAIADIKEEIQILQTLDHPNIIKYFETFENEKFMYLVMEHCEGGELFDRLTDEEAGQFTEQEAAQIMKKLFHAISHCHSHGITHRDLKPENIMYKKKDDKTNSEIKIIDFGLSKFKSENQSKMQTTWGTPYYVAPEVLDGSGYGQECDIWSLGVIMYILLSGYLPFFGSTLADIYDKIMEKKVNFEKPCWKAISEEAITLIKGCLNREPKNRITASDALKSSWFQAVKEKDENPLSNEVYQSLISYRANSILKKEAMKILIKMMREEEIEDLRAEFRKMDTDFTGTISAHELEQAIRNMGKEVTANEIDDIIKNVDYLENGRINYSEFLAATISARAVISTEMLWALFKHFDTDNSGYITPDNIIESFEKAGRQVNQSDIDNILAEHDIKKDGHITFDEFKVMMSNLKVLDIEKTLK